MNNEIEKYEFNAAHSICTRCDNHECDFFHEYPSWKSRRTLEEAIQDAALLYD